MSIEEITCFAIELDPRRFHIDTAQAALTLEP